MFAAMRHQESLDDLWSPIAISQYLRYLRLFGWRRRKVSYGQAGIVLSRLR